MSLAEALQKYAELNDGAGYDEGLLKQAYERYSDQFEAYMAEHDQDKAAANAKQVRGSVTKPNLFKTWTAQFKREKLSKILARVAAVWSVMVSEDVSEFFKPHCFQVLCVLQLLGSDSDLSGVSKQLAQVLMGQGKSLVLALIATILALTGHEIQLVCYNEYLVKRDAKDFADLYELFDHDHEADGALFFKVSRSVLRTTSAAAWLVVVGGPASERPNKPKAKVQDNSVLLVDEDDVFFTKDYYESQYCPIMSTHVHGEDEIQEEIWYVVNDLSKHDVQRVTTRIQTVMSSSMFKQGNLFSVLFLNKREAYDLLVESDNGYVRKTYTNKSLFAEHLNLIIFLWEPTTREVLNISS
ncbi:conserved hypothetical protein [Culex quinquefasciatus]|uniref:SecA DEAD-like N-terminal domain-containing protein n=1 Tax=Culex quinquefasciatus TaxID=7176 RepID=B0X344_CULQU|nr:conserved hypothetical protein [Culex quinquefasciatus]|eukprot:XP_001864066.1 conserved hypothetical protein [Culex quinquefasciatus]